MNELLDLIALRKKLLTQHPYAALSMLSRVSYEICTVANVMHEKVIDVARQELPHYENSFENKLDNQNEL